MCVGCPLEKGERTQGVYRHIQICDITTASVTSKVRRAQIRAKDSRQSNYELLENQTQVTFFLQYTKE